MNKSLSLILFFYTLGSIKAQEKLAAGASVIYNFQTESLGAGIRATVFPNNKLSFTPQFSYFFPFNKVTEYYVGLAAEYKFLQTEKLNYYVLGHGAYNQWTNYNRSAMKDARPTNWNFEVGAGISTQHCLRPFLEYRYNFRFRETHLDLGFLYVFGCKSYRTDKNSLCPAYH